MSSNYRSIVNREEYGYVSTIHKRHTEHSTHLCIFNASHKFLSGIYDIGGTYFNNKPHMYFYMLTSACHGDNYLLSLFVMTRQPHRFSIMLPKNNRLPELINANDAHDEIAIEITHEEFTFQPKVEDENIFLKTFLITQRDLKRYDGVNWLIPIKITVTNQFNLNNDIVRSIRNAFNSNGLLTRDNNTDYEVESSSGEKFSVHKVILAASSPVLRNLISSNTESLKLDVESSTIEILLEFLYRGSVLNIMNQDNLDILKLAEKFELAQLSSWIQEVICKQIDVNNAVDIAVTAKKFKLKKMSETAFAFIKRKPEVLNTTAWKKLDDAELLKSLLSFYHEPDKSVLDELARSMTADSNSYITFTPRYV